MKLTSVVIPTYNQPRYLAYALESVQLQDYPSTEVIVVDDGSEDATHEVLERYESSVRCIRQRHQGLSAARNAGYREAQGEFILFLDSDDGLRPDAISRFVAAMEEQPELGLVYSAWQQIGEDETQVFGEVHPNVAGKVLKQLLLREFYFYPSAAVIRRGCLSGVPPFNESLKWGEDADLWLRLAKAGWAFGYIDEPLVRYRVHEGSMTASVTAAQIEGWKATLVGFFEDPEIAEEIRALKPRAYSVMHFETAGRYFRTGDIKPAREQLRAAVRAYPTVDKEWILEWIAGTAQDPRTRDPHEFIDRVCDHVVPEAQGNWPSRRQAHARAHVAAAFAAHASRNTARVRRHLLPAIWLDPSILRNRGFIRIAVDALLSHEKVGTRIW
jgi:glycosyltransferase involved in cell wall biosynthesis